MNREVGDFLDWWEDRCRREIATYDSATRFRHSLHARAPRITSDRGYRLTDEEKEEIKQKYLSNNYLLCDIAGSVGKTTACIRYVLRQMGVYHGRRIHRACHS
mgnify:CR=1 FL=1